MNHDPSHFPDHDDFRPERYLDSEGQLSDEVPNTHHLGHMSFGTGRRYLLIQLSVLVPYQRVSWQGMSWQRDGRTDALHRSSDYSMGIQRRMRD